MALKQRDESKKYIRIKDGKLYVGKDLETPYDEIEGTITNLYYKNEEYEGTPQRKLIIVLNDNEGSYQLGVNVESSSYSSLIGFLPNIEITKPITLHPRAETITKDGKEVTRRSILVSQEGKFAKAYFTKDHPHGLPKWEVVQVGKKKVTDKTEYLEFLENFVQKNLISKINVEQPVAADVDDEDEVEDLDDGKAPWE